MEAAKALNAEKNGVKISGVLDSILQTQVARLAGAIKHKSPTEFPKTYDETLAACNACHTEAGYRFIHMSGLQQRRLLTRLGSFDLKNDCAQN